MSSSMEAIEIVTPEPGSGVVIDVTSDSDLFVVAEEEGQSGTADDVDVAVDTRSRRSMTKLTQECLDTVWVERLIGVERSHAVWRLRASMKMLRRRRNAGVVVFALS